MKLMADISKKSLEPKKDRMVNAIQHLFHLQPLETPLLSSEIRCPMCNGMNGETCLIDPSKGSDIMWFCVERVCLTSVINSRPKGVTPPTTSGRAILWGKFCEINGIGNANLNVKFEDINQSQSKLDCLLKFIQQPCKVIVMQGDSGVGKTYMALGACEYFTRTNLSCIFSTQKKMQSDWLDAIKSKEFNNYIYKIKNCSLLVVDDFGTGEIPPGFMSFFMDVMDTRLQWTNRGTIITTNLNSQKLGEFCGEALTDRLNTGYFFKFVGTTRRKPIEI